MTFEEKGAYMELLMMQFNRGHMSSHMIGQTIGQLWDKIKDKFEVDSNGLYYNVRLEIEQKKRKAFTESRKNNIKGENQYTKNYGHKDGHMSSHMENENINENKDLLNKNGAKIPYEEIKDLFNKICTSLSKIQSLSNSRKEKIKVRWNELNSIEKFKELFEKTQASSFCIGDNKDGWKASFDWLMENDKNWLKVLEGNYDKNKQNGKDRQSIQSEHATDAIEVPDCLR